MRIAVASTHETGVATPLASLWFAAPACRELGIELEFIWTQKATGLPTLRAADRVIFDGANVLRHYLGPFYYAAARALRKPTALYSHETAWNLRAATSLVPTFMGPLPIPLALRHALVSRKCVHFHVCEPGIELLVERYGVGRERTHRLANITDASSFLARELPCPTTVGLNLIVGKVSERKGADLLFDIAERVVQRDPRRRFRWLGGFGGGPFAREACLAMAAERGLADHIEFLGFRRDVADHMAQAELVLSVSRDDPMPKVLMEALALGKHCVAFDVGGIPDLLGEHGTVIPRYDRDAFAEAVLRGTPDDSLAAQEARRAYFRERFSEAAFAHRFQDAVRWWSSLL